MLKKSDVPDPPQSMSQIVPVPELGGDVMVRSIMLRDLLKLQVTESYGRVASLLAVAVQVHDERGEYIPLYTEDQWELWGKKHYAAAVGLWNVARKLAGLDVAENEKNSPAQTSESHAA